MAIWSRLFSGIFGVGVGIAAADAVQPVVEVARQEAWKGNANRVLAPGELAPLLAQGLIPLDTAIDYAERNGYSADKLEALAQAALRAPAAADVRTLRRRGLIPPDLLHHSYAKAQIEPQYWDTLDELINEHLSPQVVALAIVRGLIPDPGILPVPPPSGKGKVDTFPVFDLDAVEEARSEGFDLTRLSILAGIAGRPMSPEAASEAYFKGIIELADFERAVSESDVRNEWRDAILDNQRFRLRPADWAGLWLRGWVTQKEAEAGGAQYGATPETMLRLYQNRGRPATPRQVHLGYARGAKHPGSANEDEAIATAVKQSDIRGEWEAIEAANRWSYPSPFVLRQLTESGVFSEATTHQILIEMGWKPEYAAPTAKAWANTPAAAATLKWTGRVATRVFTQAYNNYMDATIDDAEMRRVLDELGATPADRDATLRLLAFERANTHRDLTEAQILRLYKQGVWAREQAQSSLELMGVEPGNASDLLDAV